MKNLIFLFIATAVVIFSIIVLNVSPNINKYLVNNLFSGNNWYDESCSHYKDKYDLFKDKTSAEISLTFSITISNDDKKEWLDLQKEGKNRCYRHKAMIGLEYAAFNINILCGFICALLGLLKYSGNNLGKIVGILGLVTGVIGFVLTLVYVIYSGIIFNNEVVYKSFVSPDDAYNNAYIRTESDGAYMKWDNSKNRYVCIFYDKDNKDSVYARYSDAGKKVYNYNKGIKYPQLSEEYKYQTTSLTGPSSGCVLYNSLNIPSLWTSCKSIDENDVTHTKYKIRDKNGNDKGECEKILAVAPNTFSDYMLRNMYDFWVISIVFSCLIIVCHIGLAIFGFLLFKDQMV